MIPVNTRFGDDCWRCCIASIIHADPKQIPHFLRLADQLGLCWVHLTKLWLVAYGFRLEEVPATRYPRSVHIRVGESPKSKKFYHAVIYEGKQMVYDPAKDNKGIKSHKHVYRIVRDDHYHTARAREARKRIA